MRQLLFTSAAIATLSLAACSGNAPDSAQNASGNQAAGEEYFTVRAGAVTDARAVAVSGNFQVQRTGAPRGIPSDGLGGACLVFAAGDVGYQQLADKQCQSNLDCSIPGENVYGYCDSGTGSCWARPRNDLAGAKTCNRPLAMTPAVLNPVPRQPVDAGALGVRPGAKVRVLACLNKRGFVPGPAPAGTGCAGTGVDALHDWGTAATVR